jgi:hypothetical protein
MKKILTSALLISLMVVSCKKEETAPVTDTTTETTLATPVESSETATPVEAVTASESNMMMQPTTNSGAINPAHGQPGHRCEIPVGAPLNTAPAAANTTAAVQKSAPTPANAPQLGAVNPNGAQNSSANQVTPPGMNPPHGQPGHTCSVAVGAPLPATN